MSQYNEGIKTFTAGEALAAHRRVKWSASTVIYADSGEAGIGVTETAAASGAPVAVRLLNCSGTVRICAAEGFAAGSDLYAANDGKVKDSSAGKKYYTALETSGADGDIVECLPQLEGV